MAPSYHQAFNRNGIHYSCSVRILKKVTLLLIVPIAAIAFAITTTSVFAVPDHCCRAVSDAGLAVAKGIGALGTHVALASGGTPTKLKIFAKRFSGHFTFLLIAVAEFLNAGYLLLGVWNYPEEYSSLAYLTFAVWIIAGASFGAASYRTIADFKKLERETRETREKLED